jgi:predicted RNA-binding Zn-ribbon protein involved in translation (DUF1610 family)
MKRKYRKFGIRYLLQNLILFVPLAALFVVAWSRRNTLDAVFCICVTLFAAGVSAALIWEMRRLRNFTCPKCGTVIEGPTIKHRQAEDPVNYYCPKCDIEWETGLLEPDIDA